MKRPEAAIQRAVFAHLRARASPGVFAFHPANGSYRKPIEAAILKGMGVVAGVPDVIAIYQGRCYALELKAEGGTVTVKQLRAIAALEAAGAFTAVDLRHEQPEQRQHREAVDEPGGEAQERRDDCRHALLRRNEELAHVRHTSFDLMFRSFPRERESRSGLLRDRLSLQVTAFAGTSGGGVTA